MSAPFRPGDPFPGDVWICIFENLSIRDILMAASLVSTALHAHSVEDALWRSLLVRDNSNAKDRIRQIADKYKGPRSFLDLYRHRWRLICKFPEGAVIGHVLGESTAITFTFVCPLVWEDLVHIKGIDSAVQRTCDVCTHKVTQLDRSGKVPKGGGCVDILFYDNFLKVVLVGKDVIQ